MENLKNSSNDFPENIPVFPLSEIILLPKGHIKLNIFENRYINMTEDSLSSNRIIGMIQPIKKDELHKIGCIGKIVQFSEIEEKKFLIELKGLCRYKIIHHSISNRDYRIAKVSYSDFNNDLKIKKFNFDRIFRSYEKIL